MITLPLVLNDCVGRCRSCRRCRDILDWYAGWVSRSGKMVRKKAEKTKTLHSMVQVSRGGTGPLIYPFPAHSPLGLRPPL